MYSNYHFSRLPIFVLIFLFTQFNIAQNTISGRVLDAETLTPLAFANISINNSKRGVISDIEGNFKLNSSEDIVSIKVSYLGFEDVVLSSPFSQNLVIKLNPTLESLDEVTITNGENPALAIIRKVMANSDQNNPLKKGGFEYTTYSKSIIDSKTFQKEADSTRNAYLQKIENGELDMQSDSLDALDKTLIKEGSFHIAVLESVTERKFLPPDLSEEKVLASRVSGFKSAYLTMLATELQPFGFYENNITLLDVNFLNPIAKGSLKRYDYVLEDTFYDENDTIFNISFQPKPKVNIDGLKGFMHINSDGYAIQIIVAEPNDELVSTLKIQQKYSRIQSGEWFPEQLNFKIETNDGSDIFIDGKTYLKAIRFNPNLSRKDFSEVQLKYEEDAPYQSEDFWQNYRKDTLTRKEKTTYKVIDSIGEEFKFDKAFKVINYLSDGFLPWGKINLNLNQFIGFNNFEGLRLGAGAETNEKLFKRFSVGGYFAYGFKDSNWKFGGHGQYNLDENGDFNIQAGYSNDVREIGLSSLQSDKFSFQSNPRPLIATSMDIVEQYQFTLERRDFKYLTWSASLRNEWIRPQYDYSFVSNGEQITNYRNTEAVFNLRYAHRERLVETPLRRVNLGTDYPVFNIRYTQGFDSFLDGQFDYHKVEASVYQSFFSKNIGKTRYHLQAGYIDSALPIGLLFTGEGSFDDRFPVVMYDRFQTMFLYEFLSDRYVHLFLTHDIGSLLFKSKNFSPGVILHHNMGWGDLSTPEVHNTQFAIKDKVFIESGLELKNLISLDMLGTRLGYGVGAFYRYGEYSLPRSSDNFAFKINVSLSLRQ
jgi:hypothetical protein